MKPDFEIPIETTAPRDVDILPADTRKLRYWLADAPRKQSVTKDRVVANPMIDLNHYRCRALFDWIEFMVTLGREYYAVPIGKSLNAEISEPGLGNAHVYGPNLERHHRGDTFRIRLFDPTSERVNAALQHLRWAFGSTSRTLSLEHQITGVEISVDFYPVPTHAPTHEDKLIHRAHMSELLRKHFRLEPSFRKRGEFDHFDELPRFKDDLGTKKMVCAPPGRPPEASKELPKALLGADRVTMHQKPPVNSTVYVGAKSVDGDPRPVLFRLQDKVADRRREEDDDYIELDLKDRRSRIEVCLLNVEGCETMEGLDIRTMEDLKTKNWETLRKTFFDFQLPTLAMEEEGTPNKDELEIFTRTGVLGLDLYHRSIIEKQRAAWDRRDGHRPRKMRDKGHCLAYSDLNQKVTRAMKKLGKSLDS